MNVWIDSPFDNLPQEGYRPQRYWLMAEAFADAGHSVVYWTGDFSHASKAKRVMKTEVAGGAVLLKLIPTLPYRRNVSLERVRSHRAYAAKWKELALAATALGELPPPDVIVSSMPTLSAAAAALELAESFKAKAVIDIMDAWPDTFHRLLPEFLRPFAATLFAPLHREARRIYRAADLVTGVCRRYGEMVARFGVENYHLAYHGIEVPETVPEPRFPQSGKLRLVYAGNLGRTYDLGTVLDAVRLSGDAQLDIAGAGPLEARWREKASRLGLGGKVRFHGYLGADALSKLLSECHLGIVPMSAESFVGLPYKLCDYAKAGLGIASSLEGECAELIGSFGTGVVYRPGDAQSLVAALRRWRDAVQNGHRPDFAGMLERLDAGKIYVDYVRAVAG